MKRKTYANIMDVLTLWIFLTGFVIYATDDNLHFFWRLLICVGSLIVYFMHRKYVIECDKFGN